MPVCSTNRHFRTPVVIPRYFIKYLFKIIHYMSPVAVWVTTGIVFGAFLGHEGRYRWDFGISAGGRAFHLPPWANGRYGRPMQRIISHLLFANLSLEITLALRLSTGNISIYLCDPAKPYVHSYYRTLGAPAHVCGHIH